MNPTPEELWTAFMRHPKMLIDGKTHGLQHKKAPVNLLGSVEWHKKIFLESSERLLKGRK